MRRRRSPSPTGPPAVERLNVVDGRTVRSLVAQYDRDAGLTVVVLPGLGALGYLLPTVRALAAHGARCVVLDLPGFGSNRPLAALPTVQGIAQLAAGWVRATATFSQLVLMGHSTGAQAALLAALQLQVTHPPSLLVLAGPTFQPSQRRLITLLANAPAAFRRDSPRELVVLPDYVRAGRHVFTLLRSSLGDKPETNVAGLRIPLLVTAGQHDAFAPRPWLRTLVDAAVLAPWATAVVLPGSHNNPFTQPHAVSALIVSAARAHVF